MSKYKNIFFFKQKTADELSECDWRSEVCCSDLNEIKILDVRTGSGIVSLAAAKLWKEAEIVAVDKIGRASCSEIVSSPV